MTTFYKIEASKNGYVFVYTNDGEFTNRNHDPKIYCDKDDAIDDLNTAVYRNTDEDFVINLVEIPIEDEDEDEE